MESSPGRPPESPLLSISGPSNPDLWTFPEDQFTPDLVLSTLVELTDLEALSTSSQLILQCRLSDRKLLRQVIDTGLTRGQNEAIRIESQVEDLLASGNDVFSWIHQSGNEIEKAVEKVLSLEENLRKVLSDYTFLYEARNRFETFDELSPSAVTEIDEKSIGKVNQEGTDSVDLGLLDGPKVDEVVNDDGVQVDDPWAEAENDEGTADAIEIDDDPWETGSSRSVKSVHSKISNRALDQSASIHPPEGSITFDIPFELPLFLSRPTIDSAVELASSSSIDALKIVCQRHSLELYPYRFDILHSIPDWVSPSDLQEAGLLPSLGEDGIERIWATPEPTDITFFDKIPSTFKPYSPSNSISARQPLNSTDLIQWYTSKIDSLDQLGLLDLQLAWVQHGASAGIPSLDALGEDLSLLSRLIYDANLTPSQHEKWNLSTWRSASENEIVSAYISNSNPNTIVSDFRRLVLPYLYVLESRAERNGKPDSHIVERHLHDAVLSLPLNLALPVFEASKATLPLSERLIRNDVNVARLALAVLYGSDDRESWSTKSAIFECLPVWDVSGGDLDSDKEATSTTLESIATFVRPTKSSIKPPTAKDLFIFFHPLPFAALSRALDILDVHLESGEILARWDVPVQLRFLLQSARDTKEQKDLAERMVRRNTHGRSSEKWVQFWEDMIRLNGGDDALLRGAFGMLGIEDMMKVYLGGVLSSGNLDVARRMIHRFENDYGLESAALEQVVLETSRELYDNAETGNIHTGEMKVAYDCLSVAPSTPAIQREKAFIEATSRLTSFSSLSLTPLEIRHTKRKLDLIRRVLSTSDDAYRHDGIILDLAEKLGSGSDVEKGEILGMLADSAVTNGEFDLAYKYIERLVELAISKTSHSTASVKLNKSKRSSVHSDKSIYEVSDSNQNDPNQKLREVTWKTCVELGRQSEYSNISNRSLLLGRAVEFCPSETVSSILIEWRKIEDGQLRLSQAAKRRRETGLSINGSPDLSKSLSSRSRNSNNTSVEEARVLGSRTAAKAAKMAFGLSERFRDNLPIQIGFNVPNSVSPRLPSLSTLSSTVSMGRDRSSSRDRSKTREKQNNNQINSPISPSSDNGSNIRGSMDSDRISLSGLGFGDVQSDAERVQRQAKRALVKGVGWLLGADEREIS